MKETSLDDGITLVTVREDLQRMSAIQSTLALHVQWLK